jgi:hypothetical protein
MTCGGWINMAWFERYGSAWNGLCDMDQHSMARGIWIDITLTKLIFELKYYKNKSSTHPNALIFEAPLGWTIRELP